MTEELKLKNEIESNFCLFVYIVVVLDEMSLGNPKEHSVEWYFQSEFVIKGPMRNNTESIRQKLMLFCFSNSHTIEYIR